MYGAARTLVILPWEIAMKILQHLCKELDAVSSYGQMNAT
jgi:hypothetical protein